MPRITPTEAQIAELLAADLSLPVVMINLLKYRDQAEYPDGVQADPCSGREAYARYGEIASQAVQQAGGQILWMARADHTLIGPEDETWDDVVLVHYPAREAFLKMIEQPAYLAAVVHREAGLADTRLIATSPQMGNLGS